MPDTGYDATRFAGLAFAGSLRDERAAAVRAAEEREQEERDEARWAAHDAAQDLALIIDRGTSAPVAESDALRTRIEELQAEARALYGERRA